MSLAMEMRGSGPALVCLHGWGMNRRVWGPLARQLEDRFRLVLLDLPGHGASSWNPSMSTLEQWAAAVLEAAPAHAAWLGWSLGGLVMQQAARLAPERVGPLVAVAATPCFVRRADWPVAMEPRVLEQFAGQLEQDHRGTLKRFLALQFQGVERGRELQREAARLLHALPPPRPGALEAGLGLLRQSDLREELSRLASPCLWILGADDRLVPPGLAAVLERLAPGLQVEMLKGAGHAPFLSHPRQVARRITEFLNHD